jgi:hypothetical protein
MITQAKKRKTRVVGKVGLKPRSKQLRYTYKNGMMLRRKKCRKNLPPKEHTI